LIDQESFHLFQLTLSYRLVFITAVPVHCNSRDSNRML